MKHVFFFAALLAISFACQKPDAELQKPHNLYMSTQMPCTYGGDTIEANPDIPLPVAQFKDTVDLIWARGQSNMPGRSLYTNYAWRDLPGRNFILNKDTAFVMASLTPSANSWQIMNIATNISDVGSKCGVQPFLVRSWFNKHSRNLYYYQTARGGTMIKEFTSPGRAYGLYEHMMQLKQVIKQFNDRGTFVNVRGTIWYQGESDGGVNPTEYYYELDKIKRITDEVVGANVPFILVQMSDCQINVKELSRLQAVQSLWANDNNAILLPKVDGATSPDGWHLTMEGYQKQADFIFNKLCN